MEGKCHQYADDTTLYAHCKPENLQDAVADMQSSMLCVVTLSVYPTPGKLKNQPDHGGNRTRDLWFASPCSQVFASLKNGQVRPTLSSIHQRPRS